MIKIEEKIVYQDKIVIEEVKVVEIKEVEVPVEKVLPPAFPQYHSSDLRPVSYFPGTLVALDHASCS